MRASRIKAKLRRGDPVLVTQLHLTDPAVFELASLLGFDGIWMDLEHHGYSVETAARLMRAVRVGPADVVARPAKGEFMRLGRLLEAGAQGIMYPRCSGPDEAAEAVRWAKFAPLGQRGCDAAGADNPDLAAPLAEYVRRANAETFLVVQLEDPAAVEQAAAIAAVDGVDGLMFGPGDFTVLTGIPGEFRHPSVGAAARAVGRAAAAAGKAWGMPAFDTEHAKELLGLGARMLYHGADIVMVRNGLLDIQRRFAPLGLTF